MLHDYENRIKDSTKSVYTEDGTKPVVHFKGEPNFFVYSGAKCASLFAVDHPFWGENLVRTSKIIKIHDNGDIETMNTLYRKVKGQ